MMLAIRMEMPAMEWRERISIDPAVCHGQACIKGARIPVAAVLDKLAAAGADNPLENRL